MTDDEILALYREKTNNPYLTLSTAHALRAWDMKMDYLRQEPELNRQPQNPEAG
jgi:hypothetical protein